MSKKFWIISSLAAVILITGIAGIGFAQKFKRFHDDGPLGHGLMKIAKELDLNEQQKAEVEKIKNEIKTKMESRKQNREDRFDEFANLFNSDRLDKAALNSLYQKHESDRQEMREFFMDELIKFHSILTPAQRTKAVEKMKEKKDKFKSFREHFKPGKDDGIPPDNN
jgi:Spy/CpxP family protein refolding chaperone